MIWLIGFVVLLVGTYVGLRMHKAHQKGELAENVKEGIETFVITAVSLGVLYIFLMHLIPWSWDNVAVPIGKWHAEYKREKYWSANPSC